jgi:hypothetical protein
MTEAASERARALLAQSLAVWRVSGTVEAGEPPVVAVIHGDGTVVRVEIAAESECPIRWWVRWHASDAAPNAVPRCRPCASTVGLLRTVREALNIEGGSSLRIAPASPHP